MAKDESGAGVQSGLSSRTPAKGQEKKLSKPDDESAKQGPRGTTACPSNSKFKFA